MGVAHILGLGWWNGRALRIQMTEGPRVGVVHIQSVEAAFASEWGAFIMRGSLREVRGSSYISVGYVQRMEAALAWAWCTFWVWDG